MVKPNTPRKELLEFFNSYEPDVAAVAVLLKDQYRADVEPDPSMPKWPGRTIRVQFYDLDRFEDFLTTVGKRSVRRKSLYMHLLGEAERSDMVWKYELLPEDINVQYRHSKGKVKRTFKGPASIALYPAVWIPLGDFARVRAILERLNRDDAA